MYKFEVGEEVIYEEKPGHFVSYFVIGHYMSPINEQLYVIAKDKIHVHEQHLTKMDKYNSLRFALGLYDIDPEEFKATVMEALK